MLALNAGWPFPRNTPGEIATSPLLQWGTARAFHNVEAERLAHVVMSPFELGARADAIMPPALAHRDVVHVVTLFDLIPLLYRDQYLSEPLSRRRYDTRLQTIRSADVVLAISERTRRDAIELLDLAPARVTNIGTGVMPFYRPVRDGEDPQSVVRAALPKITRPFILCVSGEENNRKNIDGLFAAFASLPNNVRREHQLVIACSLSAAGRSLWTGFAKRAGLVPEEYVLTGFVTDEVLLALNQTARAAVAPSLYEGFGLPAFEAAACGCPSVGSRTSALPDLVDDPRAIFDPTNVDEIAQSLMSVLVDTAWRESLVAKQSERIGAFTWDTVAQRTLSAINAAASPRAVRRPPRRRIAVLSPLPPTRSGVADYTARVLPALQEIADVDVFSVGDAPVAPLLCEARVRPADAFVRHVTPGAYDGVIYVIGNNGAHKDLVGMASRLPGMVWFHDTHLASLSLSVHRRAFDPGYRRARTEMLDQLQRQYGPRVPAEVLERWHEPAVYDEFGLGLTGELVSGAVRVLVNSAHAERLIRLDQPPTAREVPITVLPFGVSAPRRELLSVAKQRGLVVAPGWMDWIKQPDLVIRAVARARRSRPDARLDFVGHIHPELARDLRLVAEASGVDVRFLGHVPEAEYWRTLAAAECAVVLRKTSHGESSATVNDALAAGTPVITNAPSAVAVPLDAVTLVPSDADESAIAAAIVAMLADPTVPAIELPSFADVAAALVDAVERAK